MKIYVTKYALTQGIVEHEAEESNGMAVVKATRLSYAQYFHNKEWHTTKEAAIEKAQEMQLKKILSLQKQIKAISEMEFK